MTSELVNKDLLCKDCIHGYVKWDELPNYWLSGDAHWMKCKKTGMIDESTFNPVTGYKQRKPNYKSAWDERGRSGDCGPQAKNWTPKHKRDLFKLLKR